MKENHKNPHKTPEGYFESFNERLMNKIVNEESIIPSNDGFSVPNQYFETIHDTLSKKLQSKVIPLKSYQKYYYAAASIAALLVLTIFFTKNNEPEFGFDDLASAEIDAYFEDNDVDISTYDLAEVVNLENVSILDITESKNSIEEDMILDYLDDNVDEIEDLNLDYEEFN